MNILRLRHTHGGREVALLWTALRVVFLPGNVRSPKTQIAFSRRASLSVCMGRAQLIINRLLNSLDSAELPPSALR